MSQLTINEAGLGGFTDYVRFDYIDLQRSGFLSTIGAANQRVIGYIPSGAVMKDVLLYQVTDPAGATDLTIDVGTTSSDPDEWLDAGDVDGATKVLWNTGDALSTNTTSGVANNTSAAVALYMEFNGTVGDLTAGEWILAWKMLRPPYSTTS